MTKFLYWLTARLPCRIINGDNGEPYLERYFLFRIPGLFTAYIHRFVDNDPDRGLHNHPWAWSCSLVLAGQYHELRGSNISPHRTPHIRVRLLRPGRFNVIRGDDWHRILLHWNRTNRLKVEAWTLFIHRPRIKGWGFIQPSIRAGHGALKPHRVQWPAGALPVYRPQTLSRHVSHQNWHREVPKGRDWNRQPLRRAS